MSTITETANVTTSISLHPLQDAQQPTLRAHAQRSKHSSEENILAASQVNDSQVPDGGAEAWRVVAGCSVVVFWFVGLGYSWGVIQDALVRENLAPPSTLAFVGSLTMAFGSTLALASTRVIRWLGARKTALLGSFLVAMGPIVSSFSTKNIAGLFIGVGVVQGIGSSLNFLVGSVTPAQYFNRKRGLANGMVLACGGLGGGIISVAMPPLLSRVGVAWTLRILGFAALCTTMPAAWLVKERAPITRRVLVEWQLFREINFIVVFIAGAIATFPLFVPPFFLPLYASSLGMSAPTGAGLVAGFNFASAGGRVASGALCDTIGPLNTLMLALLVSALSMLTMWPFSDGVALLAVFAVVQGAANGGFFSTMPTVVGNVFGSARVSVVMGMIISGWAGGYLMGAPIAGYLLAAYGGAEAGFKAYRPAMFYAGSMALASASLIAFVRFRTSTKLLRKL